jgi:mannose-6-phosphate isomerase-like protein (cupin superfamily)
VEGGEWRVEGEEMSASKRLTPSTRHLFPTGDVAMQIDELAPLLARHKEAGRLYLEFLRVPSLSMGLYVLPAGATDPQKPHDEDEVYYVLSGRAVIQVGGRDRLVEAGTVVFVEAKAAHHFHTITETLTLLVFFAPAEGSQSSTP